MAKSVKKQSGIFRHQLALDLAELGKDFVRPKVLNASSTLADALFARNNRQLGTSSIRIPHYWAVYVHDGVHGRISPKNASVLVFYPNKNDDPRFEGGHTPIRRVNRKLTKRQFKAGIEENKKRKAQGRKPFMVIAKMVTANQPGEFFFSNKKGMSGFRELAGDWVSSAFSEFVRESLREELNIKETLNIKI